MASEITRKTIQDFGYAFNSTGVLRKLEKGGHPGDEGFEFNVSPDHSVNQKNL